MAMPCGDEGTDGLDWARTNDLTSISSFEHHWLAGEWIVTYDRQSKVFRKVC